MAEIAVISRGVVNDGKERLARTAWEDVGIFVARTLGNAHINWSVPLTAGVKSIMPILESFRCRNSFPEAIFHRTVSIALEDNVQPLAARMAAELIESAEPLMGSSFRIDIAPTQ